MRGHHPPCWVSDGATPCEGTIPPVGYSFQQNVTCPLMPNRSSFGQSSCDSPPSTKYKMETVFKKGKRRSTVSSTARMDGETVAMTQG
jgi:hypothetical protein